MRFKKTHLPVLLRLAGGAWSTSNALISARPGSVCRNGALYSGSNKPKPPNGKRGDADVFACPNLNCDWTAKSWCMNYITNKAFTCPRREALEQVKEGIFANDEEYEDYDEMGQLETDELRKLRHKANSALTSLAIRARNHLRDGRFPTCTEDMIPLGLRSSR